MDLREGLELNEHLRLLRPLTRGGMAQLWVAEHRTLGVEVVVKVLTPNAAKETTAKLRFMREARVTAKVRGPHVAHVLDYDEGTLSEEDDAFLVMELLEGEDLSVRILRNGCLSVRETLMVVEHVASALDTAHGLGVIHRDVKPENVFLVAGQDGILAKLVDFGIAKDAAEEMLELTRADAVMGTPHYMSPEQMVSARDVDSRCDVWSLAVVAYVCLTGKTPFDGASFGAVCVATHRGVFAPPAASGRISRPRSMRSSRRRSACPSRSGTSLRATCTRHFELRPRRIRTPRPTGTPRPRCSAAQATPPPPTHTWFSKTSTSFVAATRRAPRPATAASSSTQ